MFRRLGERNASNMNFVSYRVVFVQEHEVEDAVKKEVQAWARS